MNESPASLEITPRPANKPAAKPPRPWRFSLATILLLLAIVALIVSHVRISRQMALREAQLSAELEAARAEVEKLRKEVGYLDVTDKKKLHIAAAPTHLDLDWKWKIFVPEGESFHVHDLIEKSSGGSSSNRLPLETGENLIQFVVYKGPEGGWKKKLLVKQDRGNTSVSSDLPEDAMSWFGAGTTSTGGLTSASGTHQYDVESTVDLLKMTARANRPRDEAAAAEEDQPETQIKVWIEPKKEQARKS